MDDYKKYLRYTWYTKPKSQVRKSNVCLGLINFFLFGEFDFVRSSNSSKLNPWIEFYWVWLGSIYLAGTSTSVLDSAVEVSESHPFSSNFMRLALVVFWPSASLAGLLTSSSFSHSSKTTIQYTAFFALFGFFLLNVFFDKDFLGEFWGLASFWIVPGFGKLSALISAVLPNFGLSEFKLSHDSLSDKLELVLALALLPRLSWPAFINLGLMEASRDCLRSMAPPLPKLFGGGPSWSKRTLLKSEESVLCRSSFWAVVGLRGSECLAIFCGCCTSATTLWILTRLFSSRRIKFFLARRSNLSSPSTWSAMFSTLIFTELRIWLKKDKITVQFTAESVDKFYPWTILGRGNQYR